MEIKFIEEDKVEITAELQSVYKKPLEERISYTEKDAKAAFLRSNPKRKIKSVLVSTQINNFRQNGLVKGKWVFELVGNKKPVALKKKATKRS